ncbi:hypothetical protein [Streptomyces sp. NPDC127197]|uniref:hypothetical protein n=1 Tax=Streptomyces sp. NPDC127197 TaxID=3345388 RepID=UPI00362991CA
MRKYQKAAVVMAMLGSVGFLGAGVSHASNDGPSLALDNQQNQECGNDPSSGFINALNDVNLSVAILGTGGGNEPTSCGQSYTFGG